MHTHAGSAPEDTEARGADRAAPGAYLPVVVSARPSTGELLSCPGAGVTVEVVSAFAMVTSLALEISSPQWGQ